MRGQFMCLCSYCVWPSPKPRQGRAAGRYVIEENSMAGGFLPSGYTCQRWGVAFREVDGSITLEREKWRKR
jgi:hypothetical protein